MARTLLLLATVFVMLLVTAICAAAIVYWCWGPGQCVFSLSNSSQEWANFGSFYGGTVGPLLSVISVVAVVSALAVQFDALKQSYAQAHRALYRETLEWARGGLSRALQPAIKVFGGGHVTIEALAIAKASGVPFELSDSGADDLKKALPAVIHWLFTCVEQVRMSQSSDKDFGFLKTAEFRYYKTVYELVCGHSSGLPQQTQLTLGLLGTHFKPSNASR